jgi:hypothetical protein
VLDGLKCGCKMTMLLVMKVLTNFNCGRRCLTQRKLREKAEGPSLMTAIPAGVYSYPCAVPVPPCC